MHDLFKVVHLLSVETRVGPRHCFQRSHSSTISLWLSVMSNEATGRSPHCVFSGFFRGLAYEESFTRLNELGLFTPLAGEL